jgi:hypothetical protein
MSDNSREKPIRAKVGGKVEFFQGVVVTYHSRELAVAAVKRVSAEAQRDQPIVAPQILCQRTQPSGQE